MKMSVCFTVINEIMITNVIIVVNKNILTYKILGIYRLKSVAVKTPQFNIPLTGELSLIFL